MDQTWPVRLRARQVQGAAGAAGGATGRSLQRAGAPALMTPAGAGRRGCPARMAEGGPTAPTPPGPCGGAVEVTPRPFDYTLRLYC